MQLPKWHPMESNHAKECEYSGCGKKFLGWFRQKYCAFHTDPRNRKRIRRKQVDSSVKNRIYHHDFSHCVTKNFKCGLKGCNERFAVVLYPRQEIYPNYCDKHRTEFQRQNSIRTRTRRRIALTRNAAIQSAPAGQGHPPFGVTNRPVIFADLL